MGCYDSFVKDDIEIQVKVGDCTLEVYKEGDTVDLRFPRSVLIHGYGGSVLIRDRKVAEIRNDHPETPDGVISIDKWGYPCSAADWEKNNPVIAAMNAVKKDE